MRRLAGAPINRAGAVLTATLILLGACAPEAPKGVSKEALDAAVSRAIGDPSTCVLIAERPGGKLVYRYNTHTACARSLPACEGAQSRTVHDLLELAVADGQKRALSCNTAVDGSRGVGWAAGVIPGKNLAYAAMMEGDRAFPGRMMAERLEGAFAKAGL